MGIRNKVQLIGNVGQDLKVITPEDGKKFVVCSLATNETYKNADGEKVKTTDWHNLTFFNKAADIAEQFITKGKMIAIEGKLKTRKYEDKEGNTRYSTDVIVTEILLLGGGSEAVTE
ncbi:MAG: single-stranded DNA-binding protein [Allomuricauda sp.]|uniref:single-stranded DNA-binding protein n=1 Tax=Sinomicrobium oceani TaxID=1150368 RepID=UPI002DD425D9|nr:single-stranded DNA-binding protein [Sinomicrobium oceani]|tara:strand:+ start:771 stop:1121 length:351 start_codon:yes stop_codon:yes gene_type:complete